MRESCTYGSVRGARGNSRPYRDGACPIAFAARRKSRRDIRGYTRMGASAPALSRIHRLEPQEVEMKLLAAMIASLAPIASPAHAKIKLDAEP
jgi:hypothetical protein